MEEKRLNQFLFYDFYWEVIKNLKDDEAGRIIRMICAYMFGDEEAQEITDKREKFFWGNLIDDLRAAKEKALRGKNVKAKNAKQYFMFSVNFYEAIDLMDDKQSGIYIKAICKYMFCDELPDKLSSPVDTYFAFAKRKLDVSKARKISGRKGGQAERIPITPEEVNKESQLDLYAMGMDGFLMKYPQIKNDLYKSSMHLAENVNWDVLHKKLPNSRYAEVRSLYQILAHYREIIEENE